jgi:hypothetical protein
MMKNHTEKNCKFLGMNEKAESGYEYAQPFHRTTLRQHEQRVKL